MNAKIVTHQTSPDWLQSLGLAPIKLGLDLNGGVLFVLDVDLVKAQQEQLDSAYEQTKTIIRDEKARGVRVQKNAHGFELHALPAAKSDLAAVQANVLKRFERLMATLITSLFLTTSPLTFL